MFNEQLEAKEYSIKEMEALLKAGKEPRLMYKSFIKSNNGLLHVLTVLAREKLFEGKPNDFTAEEITTKDIENAEKALADWISGVYCDSFADNYMQYLTDVMVVGKNKNYSLLENLYIKENKKVKGKDEVLLENYGIAQAKAESNVRTETEILKQQNILAQKMQNLRDGIVALKKETDPAKVNDLVKNNKVFAAEAEKAVNSILLKLKDRKAGIDFEILVNLENIKKSVNTCERKLEKAINSKKDPDAVKKIIKASEDIKKSITDLQIKICTADKLDESDEFEDEHDKSDEFEDEHDKSDESEDENNKSNKSIFLNIKTSFKKLEGFIPKDEKSECDAVKKSIADTNKLLNEIAETFHQIIVQYTAEKIRIETETGTETKSWDSIKNELAEAKTLLEKIPTESDKENALNEAKDAVSKVADEIKRQYGIVEDDENGNSETAEAKKDDSDPTGIRKSIKVYKSCKKAIDHFKTSAPDYIDRDTFINYDRQYTYKSIIAEAIAQGKLKNYKVYIPKSLILRQAKAQLKNKDGVSSFRKDLTVKFVYMTAFYALEIYKRAGSYEEYEELFANLKVPFSYYEFQNCSGIGNFDKFDTEEYEINGKDFAHKETVGLNAVRFALNKDLLTLNDERLIPRVTVDEEKLGEGFDPDKYICIEENPESEKDIKEQNKKSRKERNKELEKIISELKSNQDIRINCTLDPTVIGKEKLAAAEAEKKKAEKEAKSKKNNKSDKIPEKYVSDVKNAKEVLERLSAYIKHNKEEFSDLETYYIENYEDYISEEKSRNDYLKLIEKSSNIEIAEI